MPGIIMSIRVTSGRSVIATWIPSAADAAVVTSNSEPRHTVEFRRRPIAAHLTRTRAISRSGSRTRTVQFLAITESPSAWVLAAPEKEAMAHEQHATCYPASSTPPEV